MDPFGLMLLFFGFIAIMANWMQKRPKIEYKQTYAHGKSDWATKKTAKSLFKGDIPLGYLDGKTIYAPQGKHIVCFGGTSSGKTTNLIIPTALTWPHSLIAFDCTGEFAAIAAHARRRFGPVRIVNPCRWNEKYVRGLKNCHYNQLGAQWLNPNATDFAIKAAKNSLGWIGDTRDMYWANSSRSLLTALQMFIVRHEKNRNIRRLVQIVSGDVNDYAKHAVSKTDSMFIRDTLMRYAGKQARDTKSLNEVLENTRTELAFAMDDTIAECMSKTDFSFSECGSSPMTVIFILPPDLVDTLAKFFQAMLFAASAELMGYGRNKVPTLFVLDEYYLLAPDSRMVSNFAGGRKYNMQFLVCLQDLQQLRHLHGDMASSILNNSGVKMWLECSDLEGSEYVSRMAGETSRLSYSKSVNTRLDDDLRSADFNPGIGESFGEFGRHLVLGHEVRQMGPDKEILFVNGIPGPIVAQRKPYFNTSLKRRARPNPYAPPKSFWG